MNINDNFFKQFFKIFCVLLFLGILIINREQISTTFHIIFYTLSPLLIGIFFFYLLFPLIDSINKLLTKNFKCSNLTVLTVIVYVVVAIFIIVGASICIPQLVISIKDLSFIIPEYIVSLTHTVETFLANNFGYKVSILETIKDNVLEMLSQNMDYILNSTKNTIITITNIMIGYLIGFYITIYHNKFKNTIKRILKICLKEDAYNDIRVLYQNSLNIFNKYVGGKLIDSFLIGVLLAICLIIGKFPYIILLSVVFGITNMIPYFGPFFAEIFGFAILMPVSFNAAITYLIMALAIQMFDCYILTPKILHSSMGVNPLIILLAVLIGGKICGFMGMLIGVPVLAVILNIFDYYITKIEKKKI